MGRLLGGVVAFICGAVLLLSFIRGAALQLSVDDVWQAWNFPLPLGPIVASGFLGGLLLMAMGDD